MKRVCFAVLLSVFVWAGAAHADVVPIDFSITVNDETTVLDRELPIFNHCNFSDKGTLEGDGYDVDWSIEGDTDPVLIVSIGFTNLTNADISVLLFANLPVGAIPPPTDTGGSFGGSITDGNGDGVTLSSFNGTSLYTAQVNGAPFQTLGDAPYSFVSAIPFATASVPVESFGIPGLTQPGPGVIVNDMGILLAFTLSAHDAAAFTANFVLQPRVIPEPATMSLMALGLVGFAGRSLRRMRRR